MPGDIHSVPIIKLTVEGMKHSILNAFAQRQVETDTYVKEELEHFCSAENLRRVIAKHVDDVIEEAIRDALQNFFRYSDGKQLIKDRFSKVMEDSANGK
jgi:hypothetical protein